MTQTPTAPGRARTWLPVVIPALTFLVGLALGWVVVAAGHEDVGAANPSTGAGASGSPSAAATSGDTVVTIPEACRQASANIDEAAGLLRDAIGSVRTFKPGDIVDKLNQLEDLDTRTRPLLDECQQVDVSRSPTPTPSSTS